MTLEECTDLLTPLALATRAQMDVPTYMAYHAMLKDIPAELGVLALEDLRTRGELEFFPSAPKIQSAAERMRRQQLALHPWSPCVDCEDQPGWRSITDRDGDSRLKRCPCRARYQQSLKTRGLLEAIAVLPGEAGVGENEQIYPRLEQLPAKLQKQIQRVVDQKVLR